MRRYTNIQQNEKGFASIVIALVLIIVLALLTVGFAQLARREQQNSLDKQLASQANYAAESGYNNAYQDIKSGQINDSNASSTECMTSTAATSGNKKLSTTALTANQTINSGSGVSYTCLLVTLNTSNIQLSGVQQGVGKHATFGTDSPLSTITISWAAPRIATHIRPAMPRKSSQRFLSGQAARMVIHRSFNSV